MEKKELTAADVWAMFAETRLIMQENERKIAEGHRILDEKLAESSEKTFAEIRKMFDESRLERQENERIFKEKLEQSRLERQENERIFNEKLEKSRLERQENERILNEKFEKLGIEKREDDRILNEKFEKLGIEKREDDRILNEKFEKLGIKLYDINSNVVGISNSNGEFAEEYFHNSLKKKMEFAGVHFDDISTTFKRLRKADGRRIEDQFDIVMLNGEAAAIIEIKYKARQGDPKQMVSQKVSNFRFLFPDYAKFKIYLGLAAFTFEESAEKEAKELGIGLLRQVGETVEYETNWVRAY